MMGDERWSREQKVNNTLQLQTRYPGHLVTNALIETIPGVEESLKILLHALKKLF
jgi:hypothetical protein